MRISDKAVLERNISHISTESDKPLILEGLPLDEVNNIHPSHPPPPDPSIPSTQPRYELTNSMFDEYFMSSGEHTLPVNLPSLEQLSADIRSKTSVHCGASSNKPENLKQDLFEEEDHEDRNKNHHAMPHRKIMQPLSLSFKTDSISESTVSESPMSAER